MLFCIVANFSNLSYGKFCILKIIAVKVEFLGLEIQVDAKRPKFKPGLEPFYLKWAASDLFFLLSSFMKPYLRFCDRKSGWECIGGVSVNIYRIISTCALGLYLSLLSALVTPYLFSFSVSVIFLTFFIYILVLAEDGNKMFLRTFINSQELCSGNVA